LKTVRILHRVKTLPRTLQTARRRGAGRVSSRLLLSRSLLPQEVLFFLTYRCNLRCRMCAQWGQDGYVRKGAPAILEDELPFESLEPVFEQLAGFKPRIFLCGGEIFLYRQWRDVLRSLQKHRLRTTIITNGTRLLEAAPDILETGVEQISLSLDGVPEVHDAQRGTPNTFQKALEGIQRLMEMRDARKRLYPRVVINSTVTDGNYKTLVPFVEILQKQGVDSITLLHFNYVGHPLWEQHQQLFQRRMGTGCPHWRGFVYDASSLDVEDFIRVVGEVKKRSFRVPVAFMPDYSEREMRAYYTGERFVPETPRGVCKGPWNTANILPNGDVSPCLDVVVGNVLEPGGFVRVWNGPRMQRFRGFLKDEKLFPVCTRCCTYYRF